jgi:hypothetical protein
MAFDLQKFDQNISTYGVQTPDRFEVNITLPAALQEQLSNSDYDYLKQFQEIMPYRALNCIPPAVVFQRNETHNLGIGPRINMPYNAIFSDFRVTMLGDSKSIIERTFNLWLNVCFNFSMNGSTASTYFTAYRDDIVSPDIVIRKFNKSGSPILDYHLYNANPSSFSSQALGWDEINAVIKFTASFHFTSYSITTFK